MSTLSDFYFYFISVDSITRNESEMESKWIYDNINLIYLKWKFYEICKIGTKYMNPTKPTITCL